MKKLITLIFVLSAWNSFGQLTLIKEVNNDLWPFQLSSGKWMRVNTDSGNNKIKSITFYNDDYSFYKSLNISQVFPYDTIGFTQNYIELNEIYRLDGFYNSDLEYTDNFFNLDSKMEFIISYQSVKNENGKTISKSTDLILNEDGNEIHRFVNLKGRKMSFYYSKNLNVSFENQEDYALSTTKIYSVPGNLPCPTSCSQKAAGIAPITQPNEFKEIQVTGFPNPSSEKVTLAYSLPEGTSFGTLRLYTQTGELVKEFKVSNQVDHLELPVSEYNSGTYFYELQAGGSSSGGKKMVVIH